METHAIRYTVTCTLRGEQEAREYMEWLTGGHIDQVIAIAGGATSAEIILQDGDAIQVTSSYTFPSRASWLTYDTTATELRRDGKERFVDTGKGTFSRTVGEVVWKTL